MPKLPILKNQIKSNASVDSIRQPTDSRPKDRRVLPPKLEDLKLTEHDEKNIEQAQRSSSKQPQYPNNPIGWGEESDAPESPASTIRKEVVIELPSIGVSLLDSEDPFPTRSIERKDNIIFLYQWFDNGSFKKSLFDEVKGIKWSHIEPTVLKMAFIHAERRVMMALRENYNLRITAEVPEQEGITLRSFAEDDILRAEKNGVMISLDDISDMVSDPDLGRNPRPQNVQLTITAIAKLYHRISKQNMVLADQAAQWHLMNAWIDDAKERRRYIEPEEPVELENLCFGARVLLQGALQIHNHLVESVAAFGRVKKYAMDLEDSSGSLLGFAHLKRLEDERRRETGTHFRFSWANYEVEPMFMRRVPQGLVDLWRRDNGEIRESFVAATEEDDEDEDVEQHAENQMIIRNFTRSLALGAKWVHQIDNQVIHLQDLIKRREREVDEANNAKDKRPVR